MSKEQRLTGTSLVRAILENIHESLKWMWQIVMALALVKAVEVFSSTLALSKVTNPFDLVAIFFNEYSLVFLSFILAFVRFYFGDSRHLDLGYKETQFHHGLMHELDKYSGAYRLADIFLLITHGVFFYFLSLHMNDTKHYLYFYLLLLFTNVLWLLCQFACSHIAGRNQTEILIDGNNRYSPLLIWSLNNIIFILIIAACVFLQQPWGAQIALVMTIVNSLVDLKLTWWYYFPDLARIHRESQNQVKAQEVAQ